MFTYMPYNKAKCSILERQLTIFLSRYHATEFYLYFTLINKYNKQLKITVYLFTYIYLSIGVCLGHLKLRNYFVIELTSILIII